MNIYFLAQINNEYVLTDSLKKIDKFRLLAFTVSNRSISNTEDPVKSFFQLKGNRIILDEEYVFIDNQLTTLFTLHNQE